MLIIRRRSVCRSDRGRTVGRSRLQTRKRRLHARAKTRCIGKIRVIFKDLNFWVCNSRQVIHRAGVNRNWHTACCCGVGLVTGVAGAGCFRCASRIVRNKIERCRGFALRVMVVDRYAVSLTMPGVSRPAYLQLKRQAPT